VSATLTITFYADTNATSTSSSSDASWDSVRTVAADFASSLTNSSSSIYTALVSAGVDTSTIEYVPLLTCSDGTQAATCPVASSSSTGTTVSTSDSSSSVSVSTWWVILLIAIGGVLVLSLIIATIACCCCATSSPSKKSTDDGATNGHTAANGHGKGKKGAVAGDGSAPPVGLTPAPFIVYDGPSVASGQRTSAELDPSNHGSFYDVPNGTAHVELEMVESYTLPENNTTTIHIG
jgi:hypothetical protein